MDSITQSGMIGLAKISVTTCKPLYETGSWTRRGKLSLAARMHVCDRYCGVFTAFPIAGDGSVRQHKNHNIVELTCLTMSRGCEERV